MIDTHCHLEACPPGSLERAQEAGVKVIAVGYGPRRWEHQAKFPVAQAFGVHPWEATQGVPSVLEGRLKTAVAVGEIGLDRSRRCSPDTYPAQERALREQLTLAQAFELPVILHLVRSDAWAWEVLSDFAVTGVVHSFSGSLESMRRFVRNGFFIGLAGNVINHPKAQQVAAQVPSDRLLLESDAPYQLSEPSRLGDVVTFVAQLRGVSPRSLARSTAANARNLFRLDRTFPHDC